MGLFEYLTGREGVLILALIAVVAVLYKRYQSWRFFKQVDKSKKKSNKQ